MASGGGVVRRWATCRTYLARPSSGGYADYAYADYKYIKEQLVDEQGSAKGRGRRANGEGTMRRRPNGAWHGKITVRAADGSRKRVDIYGRDRSEVAARMQDAAARSRRGLPYVDPNLRLEELIQMYFGRKVMWSQKPKTVRHYKQMAGHLGRVFGRSRVVDLRPSDFTAMWFDMIEQGYAQSTVNRVRSVGRVVFRWAEGEGLVYRNVVDLSDSVPHVLRSREAEMLTIEELHALFDACRTEEYGLLVAIMVVLGLRPGEAAGLCWSNVDLESRVVHVAQARLDDEDADGRRSLVLGELKPSTNPNRRLAIPEVLLDMFASHRRFVDRLELRAGPNWKGDPPDLVFPSRVGTPLTPKRVRELVARVAAAADIEKNVLPYDGRHSNVSLLVDAGVDAVLVADVEGHDPRTALGVYRRRMQPVITAHVEPMDHFFRAGFTDPTDGRDRDGT
jgi:integrase